MFNRNQIVLLVISLFIFVISGVLFYQGLIPEFKKIQSQGEASFKNLDKGRSVQVATESGFVNNSNFEQARVVKVIDGDTIEVEIENDGSKQIFKVRYLGIDTPETVDPRRPIGCFGREASNENKRLMEGKIVYLEKDISETDKFGRLLRYIYLRLEDGQMLFVNDYLIREGFAQVSTYPPDVKYTSQFTQAQTQARENNRGLWSACK